jgi:hypothetical protein
MPDDQPPPSLPQYSPPNPKGLVMADRKQSSFLMKAIRVLGKMAKPRTKIRGKSLQANQYVRIGRKKKPKFY